MLVFLMPLLLVITTAKSEIIHSERSLYRKILVEDSGNLRCLKFNTKQSKTSQSCFNKSNPQALVFNYTKLLFSALLVNPEPKRILIIGLGGGTMSNTLAQLLPNSTIDNVEIDEAVVKVAREYFGFFENQQIKTYTQDGRLFIKRALLKKQQYDWIILDAFNGDYIPEHLLTTEFLQESKDLLADGGVLTSNTFSVSKLYAHESATYQAVFGEFYNVRNKKNNNRIILVSNEALPSRENLQKNVDKLSDKLSVFNIDSSFILKSMTSTKHQQDWPKNTRLLTDQFSPANILNQ
jgi:spermidine synthase